MNRNRNYEHCAFRTVPSTVLAIRALVVLTFGSRFYICYIQIAFFISASSWSSSSSWPNILNRIIITVLIIIMTILIIIMSHDRPHDHPYHNWSVLTLKGSGLISGLSFAPLQCNPGRLNHHQMIIIIIKWWHNHHNQLQYHYRQNWKTVD